MSASIAEMGARLLLQAVATLPDTIVTKQVETNPGWFSKFTSIASGLMTVALLVLTVFLVPAAWRFRHTHKKISEMLDRVYGDINPIMRHASTIVDNVDYITTSMRVDVQTLRQTLATANEQLVRASRQTERRLQELNALLDVVQTEAEDVFVSTASTLRGVREGARFFRGEVEGHGRLVSAADPLDVDDAVDEETLDAAMARELDAALGEGMDESFDDGLDDAFEDEVTDGDDRALPPDGRDAEKPRIRPRRAGRGPRHA